MSDLTVMGMGGQMPAHLVNRFGTGNADLSGGVSGGYPILSFKGKVWHVCEGDKRTLVANADGEPRSSLELVLLKANPHLSKIYYPGGYEEGSAEKPSCYSNDSIAPAPDVQVKQSDTCAVCPHNAWGSRISENGSKGKACSDSRRMAVAPVGALDNPMLLRVPAGSLKELSAYAQQLDKAGAPYQALVTKIGFDHTVAHQKLTFSSLRWLSDAEAQAAQATLEGDKIPPITGFNPVAPVQAVAAPVIAGTPPASVAANVTPLVQPKPAPVQAPPPPPPVVTEPINTSFGDSPAPVAQAVVPERAAQVLTDADSTLDDILAQLDD